MRLLPRKLAPPESRPDHRTEDLLDKMDVFLKDIKDIADEIRERLDREDADGDTRT